MQNLVLNDSLFFFPPPFVNLHRYQKIRKLRAILSVEFKCSDFRFGSTVNPQFCGTQFNRLWILFIN